MTQQANKTRSPLCPKSLTQKVASLVTFHACDQGKTSIVTSVIKIYVKSPAIVAFNYNATEKQPYYFYKLFSLSKFRWNYCHDLLKTPKSESIPFQSKTAGAELAML